MTTPTMIRLSTPLNGLIGTVITVTTRLGFAAHFQTYMRGTITEYRYGMKWHTEQGAVAQFDRWCSAQRWLLVHEAEQGTREYCEKLKGVIRAYAAEREAEGYDAVCAENEAAHFYGVLMRG